MHGMSFDCGQFVMGSGFQRLAGFGQAVLYFAIMLCMNYFWIN
jgi:hypothetical protein